MTNLKLDLTYARKFVTQEALAALEPQLQLAQAKIARRDGAGGEFLGWTQLPEKMLASEELHDIKELAAEIKQKAQVLVVVGIGGSYLGASAAVEFLDKNSSVEVLFSGHDLSARALEKIWQQIGERDFLVNVVSKSGTTLEPALAFRWWREKLEERYGSENSRERIFATTDGNKGVLKSLADKNGWRTLVIPDDVGGRYSVLTAVGLLPLAVAGAEIEMILRGAALAARDLQEQSLNNQAWQYAAYRFLLHRTGKTVEVFGGYEPSLRSLGAWWQQLFGESEGKNGQGIYPTTVNFTADLHSLGQYLQEGRRELLETIVWLDEPIAEGRIPDSIAGADFGDGLNYLSGQTYDEINRKAFLGTLIAHEQGGVPNLVFHLARNDEQTLGYFFYFMEHACALSAYLLGVNPFDQPGVEAYKSEMHKLLQAT